MLYEVITNPWSVLVFTRTKQRAKILGKKMKAALGMTGDFGFGIIGKGYVLAAVPGGKRNNFV